MSDDSVIYVAEALMKTWFPKRHDDKEWLESEDGIQWTEISLLDAAVAIESYLNWMNGKTE